MQIGFNHSLTVGSVSSISKGLGVHLVPLFPETYAMTFPREGLVRFRAPALVPLYPETYAMTFPREGLVRIRAPALVPLYPLTYAMTFPRE